MNFQGARNEIQALLRKMDRSVRRKDYYWTIGLPNDRTLAVDLLTGSNVPGHVRIHVFNVTHKEASLLRKADSPITPTTRDEECSKCHRIPAAFPAWYPGPNANGNRRYYGFQWHCSGELTGQDLDAIQKAAAWLLKRFSN